VSLENKEVHVCPNCHCGRGWSGPPFKGFLAKLKAIYFHIKRRTLFSHDPQKNPFLRCLGCGYVITFEEYKDLPMLRPPTCHAGQHLFSCPSSVIVRVSGSQARKNVSPKHFKPRTAHEKRLLKPKAKLEEEN